MAKFAPVIPVSIAQGLDRYGVLGTYHLLLAHYIVRYPKEHDYLYNRAGTEIILDNSVIELGNAVDMDTILRAAHTVRPATTVLPDVLLDTEATIEACSSAYPIWVKAFQQAQLKPAFMIVPQGKTLEDWVRCAEHFADDNKFPFINFWGIPRNAVKYFGTRMSLPTIARALNPHRTIHLLGFSDNVLDDVCTAQLSYVHGIDSAVPFRAINQGIPINLHGDLNNMPPRGDWLETATFELQHVAAMRTMQQWFGR